MDIDIWHLMRRDEAKKGLEVLSFTRDYCIPFSSSFEVKRINIYDHVEGKNTYISMFTHLASSDQPHRSHSYNAVPAEATASWSTLRAAIMQ